MRLAEELAAIDVRSSNLITNADLKTQTKADLARTAKDFGVSGWQGMKKEQLIAAIAKASKRQAKKTTPKSASNRTASRISKAVSAPKSVVAGGAKKIDAQKTKSGRAIVNKEPVGTLKDSKPTRRVVPPQPVKGMQTATATNGKNGAAKKLAATDKMVAKPSKAALKKAVIKPTSKKIEVNSTNPKVLQRIRQIHQQREAEKDLSFRAVAIAAPKGGEPSMDSEPRRDRIALIVRDAYWLHASWDLTRQAVERAKAAMAEHWHTAHPVLRLLRLDSGGTTNTAETVERDIPIHGGVRNWYIDLNGIPGRLRVLIGFVAANARFHTLAKSNIVNTPAPGSTEAIDDHWSDISLDPEKFFAFSGGYDSEQETGELKELFEDRLKRSMGTPALAKFGSGAEGGYERHGDFRFDVEVELVVYGATLPDGYVTLGGEPVKLHPDGTFAIRLPFPDRRQVLPAVACSRDGVQQRTVVIAVERNTKFMEPLSKEHEEQA